MYLLETGLGETFKQRKETPPAKETPKAPPTQPPKAGKVARGGDVRVCSVGRGHVGCSLELRVRFRSSFDEFLKEVEAACGRWMAPPTARRLVKTMRLSVEGLHNAVLKQRALDNDPLLIGLELLYRRSGGQLKVEPLGFFFLRRLIDL